VTTSERVLLAVALVAVDVVLFAVPLIALVAAWVLLARPPWFRQWVERLYAPDEPRER
jgi:hypothetical protein